SPTTSWSSPSSDLQAGGSSHGPPLPRTRVASSGGDSGRSFQETCMATTERLMPLSTSARRKSDGTAYTPDDREAVSVIVDGYTQTQTRVPYFELSQNGGVRQFVHAAYLATVYRAKRDY